MAPLATSTVTSTTITQGPAPPTHHAHPAFPAHATLSPTHWEVWVFDAVSQDPASNAALEISFFRDATGLFRGRAPLRIAFHAQLPGGGDDGAGPPEAVHFDEVADESVVEDRGDAIVSTWRSARDPARTTTFEYAADLSGAVLTFDLPEVRGTVTYTNAGGGSSAVDGFAAFAPKIAYAQPMVAAGVEAALTFADGRALRFAGKGGGDRCAMQAPMPLLLDENTYVRGHAGPYTFALLRSVSRLDRGRECVRASLARDGEVVFVAAASDVSLADDHVVVRAAHGGNVRGTFADTSSGWRLDFVSPAKGKHWHFDVQHQVVWWSIPLGPPPAKLGNNGFTSRVSGGEVGGEKHEGMAVVGHLQMPQMPATKK
ncbi:uncharacterized protein LTHEOB_10364 [Neofusicoccum parvum]|uniref:Uncharacterized protein LTHEOB_10364 n=1 Tax=Neofusicoccum parvum TaxID=310453 RepID=A0ACB5S4N3_9PEZI|nr:uncharacterized protein LTHEOB_10364 [Neofusicoccum parvum]